ncbi:hypothetical protein [Cetobacterium sp.]|uniref:hypothetical protein n=1 Tax=Cetobacterium sp. TaxID=2071632 RepID=UPI003EE53085
MYINSKHLQILHLIKNNPTFTLKDISEILDLSQQHIKLYLNDIYEEISEKNISTLKIDEVLKEISSFKGTKKILRKSQQFTKNQKVFYFLFFLSISKKINFSTISKELDLTTRNLNNYKEIINNILRAYNLKLFISSKGVHLLGTNFNLRRLHYFLFFKFLIEKDYLPYKFRKDVLLKIELKNFYKLRKDIYRFLTLLHSQHSPHQQATILAFFLTFKGNVKDKTINQISFENCLKYKPNHWKLDFFYEIFCFLKNSSFKDIKTVYIYLLFNIVDTFNYSRVYFINSLDKDILNVQNIFSEYLGTHILDKSIFFPAANPWIYYCKIKQLFFIDDFSLVNLNLEHIPNSNVLNMTKKIRKTIPSFTIFEGIFLWFILLKKEKYEEINVFVFKSIEKNIIPMIVNEIYKKHSIKITKSFNSKEINQYLKNNKVDNIITIENIKIYNTNITVKNLYFPVPNYKKFEK